MPLPKDFTPFLPGYRMPNGSRLQDLQDAISSLQNAVVALAGGGQNGATLINGANVEIRTVATAGDSVILPLAVAGYAMNVVNTGANNVNIFPAVGDQINGAGANTAYALAAGKSVTLFVYISAPSAAGGGSWRATLSA